MYSASGSPRMSAAPPSRRPDQSQSDGSSANAEPTIAASRPLAVPTNPTRPARWSFSMRSSRQRTRSMWTKSSSIFGAGSSGSGPASVPSGARMRYGVVKDWEPALQRQEPRVLEQLLQVHEEARRARTVGESVVDAAREVHVLPHLDLVALRSFDDAGALHDPVHAEDRDVREVDDRHREDAADVARVR